MSANVETMFYTREKPWHGLGRRVEEAPTSADALRLAGLDWTVERRNIYDERGNVIPGYGANTRTSDGQLLGIVGKQYSIVQNEDAFAFTDALIGEGIRYETAGSLRNGKQVWLLGKMPERYILGDKVEPYICFTNTHDGSGAVRVCMTPVRVVCNNTLNMALRGAKRAWSTPHKGNVQERLEEARKTLELAEQYVDKLGEEAERLANDTLTDGEAMTIITAMFPVTNKMTERQARTAYDARDGIVACMMAPDLVKFAGTKWGFVNAVADYVGHATPVRKTATYEENRWQKIMGGHPLLDKALATVGM